MIEATNPHFWQNQYLNVWWCRSRIFLVIKNSSDYGMYLIADLRTMQLPNPESYKTHYMSQK